MHDNSHARRLSRAPRARLLAATALLSAVLVAGCGGGAASPPVATVNSTTTAPTSSTASSPTTTTSTTTTSNAAVNASPPTQAALEADELAYSKCMRTNGVPNFPDPKPGGGFEVAPTGGANGASPSFTAAEAKCAKILPDIGGPGSGPPPSAQALAHWVTVAQCMRRHGISNFPDPKTTFPSHPPAGVGEISDRDGVILVFPHTLDMESPLFTRAASACGFQLTNH